MGAIRDQSEKMFNGEITTRQFHPLMPTGEYEEVADGVMFYRWFANVTAAKTGEGLVLIDTGAYFNQQATLELLRKFSPDRVNTAIYTHGHVDHACGTPVIMEEARSRNLARPRIVGQKGVSARFDRYKRTQGYNNVINTRQFSRPSSFPTEYVYPDTYFDNQLNVVAGEHKFDCHHARGETDDHCWVFISQRKVLCTGDLIIWAAPNAGNPQKAQRYAREWAEALRTMAKLGAEVLLPGHGYPVFGALRVRRVLNDTAEFLQSLYDQAIAMMNAGASLDEVIHSVKPPANLADKPYLQPVYDDPEFIVRNIWRLEGGWYDGTPSHLKPATEAARAQEIASLAGGADKVVARALEKLGAGDLALAAHLADWAVGAAPEDKSAHAARSKIYQARADAETSTMAHGIFHSTALESAKEAGIAPPEDKRSF
ncbi:MAG TPA: alkyl sulfatase dimerization domain-containing protein [Candidatus Binataceae bacterium]|nr:alkyl sulfatase dimerization domain-containing protein [Candidatus Binataceae bacterium]